MCSVVTLWASSIVRLDIRRTFKPVDSRYFTQTLLKLGSLRHSCRVGHRERLKVKNAGVIQLRVEVL